MSTALLPTPSHFPTRKYHNFAEWWQELGEVPLERIIMDPWIGTATEQDLLVSVERDKRLCELIDGTLVEKPTGYIESLIAGWLITELNNFVGPRNRGFVSGEAGMIRMICGRVRLPDVAYVSFDDLPDGILPSVPIPTLRPTLAVEVLSSINTKREIQQKLKEYFESGTKLAWIIDPEDRSISVYDRTTETAIEILNESDLLDGRNVLHGFSIPVAKLFARLPH